MTSPKQMMISGFFFKERICVPTKLEDIAVFAPEIVRIVMGGGEAIFVRKDGYTLTWESMPNYEDIQLVYDSLKNIKTSLVINKIGIFFLQGNKPYVKKYDGTNGILGENQYSAIYAKYDFAAFVKEDYKLQLYPGNYKEIQLLGKPKYISFNENANIGILIGTTLSIYNITEDSINEMFLVEEVVSFDAGVYTFLVLKVDGTVWQYDPEGSKIQVTGIPGLPISVFAGNCHYGAVTLEGECYLWGWGFSGQLGCGSFTISETPTKAIIEDRMKVIEAIADIETTVFVVVPAIEFAPVVPKEMLNNDYVKTARIESYAIAGYKPVSEDETF